MNRPEPASESPAELAERIRAGDDRAAEARLVERYARGVRIVLARHTRDPAEADAIAADLGLTGGQFNRVLHRARQRYKVLYL